MKQYDVSNLYIIKLKEFYFFCEKDIENTYKDIFTDEVFIKEEISLVKPLDDLYELEVMKKILEGEPLIISKKDLLIKNMNINSFVFNKIRSHKKINDVIRKKEEYLKVFKELSEKYPEKAEYIAKKTLKYIGE